MQLTRFTQKPLIKLIVEISLDVIGMVKAISINKNNATACFEKKSFLAIEKKIRMETFYFSFYSVVYISLTTLLFK
jgi:hypothetical protein